MAGQTIPHMEVDATATHDGSRGRRHLALGLAVNAALMLVGLAVWATRPHVDSNIAPAVAFAPVAVPYFKSGGGHPAALQARGGFMSRPQLPTIASMNRRNPFFARMSANDAAVAAAPEATVADAAPAVAPKDPVEAAPAAEAPEEVARAALEQLVEGPPATSTGTQLVEASAKAAEETAAQAKAAEADAIAEARRTANAATELKDKVASEGGMAAVAIKAMESFSGMEVVSDVKNMGVEDQKKFEEMKVDVVAKAKTMPGISGPLGFFDPVGFCSQVSEGRLCFFREVEIKHGRVAMLATLGFLVSEAFHPLFGGNIDVPAYIAFQETPLQTFWPAVVAAIAIPEVFSIFTFREPYATTYLKDGQLGTGMWTVKTDREGGDFGFDPLNLKPKDPKEFKIMQTKELNNGRLAMIAAAGMIAQELVTGAKLLG